MRAKEFITEAVRQRLDPKCWKNKHKAGTKIKGGVRVNNCVPNQGVAEGRFSNYPSYNRTDAAKDEWDKFNLDAAQRAMDRRAAEGEDMTGATIDKKTFKIVKPKQQGVAEGRAPSVIQTIRDNISGAEISKDREGNLIFRRGFFYTNNGSAEKFAARIDNELTKLNIPHTIVDKGEVWRPFKGSATTKSQSHWWVKVNISQPSVAEGLKQTLRRFDPTIKARIRQKSQDQTNQGLDTIQHLADLDLTSDDMVSRAMKPNTYFRNAERYAKLANKGVAEDELDEVRRTNPLARKLRDLERRQGALTKPVEQMFHVTAEHHGSNQDVPLYTKTYPVRANSEQEAINTVIKIFGGRNHRIEQGVAEGNIWHGTDSGSNEADNTDHNFEEATQYIKGAYPFHKTYNVYRAEPGFRALFNPRHFLMGLAHTEKVDSGLDQLQLKRNPMMSGGAQVSASIGYSWSVLENASTGIALLYYQDRGMGSDQVIIAAKDKQQLAGAIGVFRDAGVIPDPSEMAGRKAEKAAGRTAILQKKGLAVGVKFSERPDDGSNMYKITAITPSGKVKAVNLDTGQVRIWSPGSISKGMLQTGLYPDEFDEPRQGVAEVTGDSKFDNMMGDIVKGAVTPGKKVATKDKIGEAIWKMYELFYSYGDSGFDYLDKHTAYWDALFTKHNGDIDALINSESEEKLMIVLKELQDANRKYLDRRDNPLSELASSDNGGGIQIQAKYLGKENFKVVINGVSYLAIIENLEGNTLKENTEYQSGNEHMWHWGIADINITNNETGDELDDDMKDVVADYIEEHHQADLIKIAIFHRAQTTSWHDQRTRDMGYIVQPTNKFNPDLKNKKPGVAEGGMPSSVIKSKQRYGDMSDKDFAKLHQSKSDDELVAMAWRHGYGKGSLHYVNKRKRGLARVEESRLYYNVIGTRDKDLKESFGMQQDQRGWFLEATAGRKRILEAHKAFGAPTIL